ncbi:MAG: type II toxin-antitoxin system Phd/YefM family antitoxin [Clostridia bacterium]|nr:type II toxin-antitoxin system Phd/YefM family antitoxin [Clostridia bacterium]
MMQIRPVSDLRNKYPEIEEAVLRSGQPIFLTKNGYGTMVLMSLEQYAALTEDVERRLDEADRAAAASDLRLTGQEVFSRARARVHG